MGTEPTFSVANLLGVVTANKLYIQIQSAFDRESLAIYEAIRHFRHLLEVRDFHILTDHKPLMLAMI